MTKDSFAPQNQIEITLDGLPVALPSERRSSLRAIRSFLETLAMEQQRILASFLVDGKSLTAQSMDSVHTFSSVSGETVNLEELPLQLLETARQQAAHSLGRAESAVTLVLINDAPTARECWWSIARELKEPLLTLSLLPDELCGRTNSASTTQLRKWQLQQLGRIIRDVDVISESDDTFQLSTALETHVVPWLKSLHDTIDLWHEAVAAGARLAAMHR